MATPLVAGSSALVRQALIARGTAQPVAELIKAVLINTADPHSGPRPNNSSGWGLLNLRRALTASLVLDNEGSLSQGESMSYTIKVTDASQELRATLVWADPPGDQLQNNLDMVLKAPDGTEARPVDAQGHSPDTQNNVEGVDVASPRVGDWTLSISAPSLARGPQPYALVVSGGVATD
jgi:hypothetical protein